MPSPAQHGTSLLSLLAGYKGASDLYIDANIQLAIAAGKQVRTCGRRLALAAA